MNILSKMSLKLQLAILAAFFTVVLLGIGVKSISDSKEGIANANMIYSGMFQPSQKVASTVDLVLRVRAYALQLLAFPDLAEAAYKRGPEAMVSANEAWRDYLKSLEVSSSPEEKALADNISLLIQQYDAMSKKVFSIAVTDQAALDAASRPLVPHTVTLVLELTKLNELLDRNVQMRLQEQIAEAESDALGNIVLMGVAVVLGLGVSFLVAISMRGSIDQVINVARKIADKRLDSRIPNGQGKTEVGLLFNAFGDMQNSMRSMISDMGESSRQLSEASAQLNHNTAQIMHSSHQQSEAASSAAASVQQLTVSIDHVSEKASSTREAADQARTESLHSSEVIRKASEQVRSIAETMQASVKLAEKLGERSQQIGVIVNTIRDIADQTNLLALNAAIEAARAGEQGRGFAVVADEVRKLAERTTSSTEEIGQVIDGIRDGIQTMVDNMKDSEAQVSDGVEMAQQAHSAIDGITERSQSVLSLISAIADALREQSISSQQVAKNVEHIAQMAEQNNDSVNQVSNATKQLDQLANGLHQNVAQFKLK